MKIIKYKEKIYRKVGERSIQCSEIVSNWEINYKGKWKPVVNIEINLELDRLFTNVGV